MLIFKKHITLLLCVWVSVCLCVHMCVCVHVCACVCFSMCPARDNLCELVLFFFFLPHVSYYPPHWSEDVKCLFLYFFRQLHMILGETFTKVVRSILNWVFNLLTIVL